MTKIERAELETDIEEIDASIDELTVAIIGLTDKPRAAVVLLDALDLASKDTIAESDICLSKQKKPMKINC